MNQIKHEFSFWVIIAIQHCDISWNLTEPREYRVIYVLKRS